MTQSEDKKRAYELKFNAIKAINEAFRNGKSYAIIVVVPGGGFVGRYVPNDSENLLNDEITHATLEILLRSIRESYIRGYLNQSLDEYMIDNPKEFLDDIDRRRQDEGGNTGTLDDKVQ